MLLHALTLAALAAEPASTGSKLGTAVFVFAADTLAERQAGKIEVDLADRLNKKGVTTTDVGARFPAPTPADDQGAKLVQEGKEAYDNLDLDTCIARLTDAALYYIKHPELTDPKKLAEVFVYLGAAEQQNSVKTFEKEFARAIKLNPDFNPDPRFFGGDVQKSYARVRAELENRGKATVLFETVPSGATLELNGRAVGVTPLAALELPAGRHFLKASRPGYQSAARFPEVTAGGDEISVRLELQPVAAYAPVVELARKLTNRASFDTAQLPPAATELGQQVQARFIVLGNVVTVKGSTKVEAQVWDVASRERLREVKFDADEFGMSNAADTIARYIDRPAPVAVAKATAAPTEGAGGLLSKPWFWAVVGAVAVGVGVSASVAAAQPPHRRFDFITGIP